MIHSTEMDQYGSFWCQEWLNHGDEYFWKNEAVEVIETIEAVEVTEAIEAARGFKAWKITTKDFRVI